MICTYKYRLYPSKKQAQTIDETLNRHRWLYNEALAQRKDGWEQEKKSVSYVIQAKWLTQHRKENETYQNLNVSSCQRTLRRLDKAFCAFFRRVKTGETPGYPRFKGYNRFDSAEFTYGDGVRFRENRLYVQYIGEIKVKLHRPIEGKIKTAVIKRQAGRYYACFSIEVERPAMEPTGAVVGLDMGISKLVTTSDGAFYEPPKYLRRAEAKLRRLQRKVARRQKGSNRRRKVVQELQRAHEHIRNQRLDTAHKIARKLVNDYDLIAVENLNTQGMMKNHHLSKSIADAAWNTFITILTCKAEEAGRQVVKVDPKYTSQICSKCGEIVKKDLSVRVHNCPHCGLVLDRDINAAKNVLARALKFALKSRKL